MKRSEWAIRPGVGQGRQHGRQGIPAADGAGDLFGQGGQDDPARGAQVETVQLDIAGAADEIQHPLLGVALAAHGQVIPGQGLF